MSAPPVGNANPAGGAQAIGGGLNVDTMNLEDLMFFVMSKRSEQLDDSVRGYAKQIEGRNGLMKQTNDMLAEVRFKSANLKAGDKATMSEEMVQFFQDNGIKLPGKVKTGGVEAGTLDEQIKAAKDIEAYKPAYTDNACIKADLSPDMINKARSLGIEPKGDPPGQNWKKGDFDDFKSQVATKLDQLNTKKNQQTANIATAQTAADKADAALKAKPDDPELKAAAQKAHANLDALKAGGSPSDPALAKTYTKEEWDTIVNSIQGFQEGLNNDSQLDMIKFQSLMSKYTTSVEMLSNVMKKLSDNASAIVRNI